MLATLVNSSGTKHNVVRLGQQQPSSTSSRSLKVAQIMLEMSCSKCISFMSNTSELCHEKFQGLPNQVLVFQTSCLRCTSVLQQFSAPPKSTPQRRRNSIFATRAAIYRSLPALWARNRKNVVSKRCFGSLQETSGKYSKKATHASKSPSMGI